ncbi:uncharacterized protein [Elaeis guineensis]|uniref:uncharacterized protein n=1 Tax=Elaeis guineensis var. tenera TaxID=51953 RepID=UPI003C6DB7A6
MPKVYGPGTYDSAGTGSPNSRPLAGGGHAAGAAAGREPLELHHPAWDPAGPAHQDRGSQLAEDRRAGHLGLEVRSRAGEGDLRDGDFGLRGPEDGPPPEVIILEVSQYLQNYLCPNFDPETATFEHVNDRQDV